MSIANSTLNRFTRLQSGKKPLRRFKRINPKNDARRSKVAKRRAKDRRSKAEQDARAEGWIRAAGLCECGCGRPLEEHTDASDAGHPEWHHTSYRKHRGVWLRRECHHRIEKRDFPHRHHAGRTY